MYSSDAQEIHYLQSCESGISQPRVRTQVSPVQSAAHRPLRHRDSQNGLGHIKYSLHMIVFAADEAGKV